MAMCKALVIVVVQSACTAYNYTYLTPTYKGVMPGCAGTLDVFCCQFACVMFVGELAG